MCSVNHVTPSWRSMLKEIDVHGAYFSLYTQYSLGLLCKNNFLSVLFQYHCIHSICNNLDCISSIVWLPFNCSNEGWKSNMWYFCHCIRFSKSTPFKTEEMFQGYWGDKLVIFRSNPLCKCHHTVRSNSVKQAAVSFVPLRLTFVDCQSASE